MRQVLLSDGTEQDPKRPEMLPSQGKLHAELYEGTEFRPEEDFEPLVTASAPTTVAVSNLSDQVPSEEVETVIRPLAFYHPRFETNWTDDQLQRLDNLRNEFAAALGGWNQNPWDPRYRELWIQAQPVIDERFQTIFGVEAFNDQQIQAVHQGD